ncbi:hypothetical protein pEaSNUABM22_00061 [Erwinia phage pEa_SNUABM_22]|uniref:Uncharacterized protein n=1 Tax=Erwinia phage pEa_SNUABM_22 TaxID=2869549 RepID=A0AAE9BUI2_9CAUD|nr:hypothetical protein MPK63_gp061 [Erwinia phage pEa_SNUABM_22]UAW96549.1 hypothetical protein pEaSNUABM22_00061 [Erwinia phage pEa_SNUABM_22]
MLFALGSCQKRFNDHQNSAINFGAIFDDNVTKDQALSDWAGNVARAVAVCNTKSGNSLTTGQVQGLKGNRLYAATIFSPSIKRSYGDANSAMSLSDLRLIQPAPVALNNAAPTTMGELGFILAERSVMYMFRSGGTPQLYSTYNTAQSYSARAGSDVIYTVTTVNSLHYTRTARMPTTPTGSVTTSGSDITVTSAIGYANVGTAQASGQFFGTIDGGYRYQISGRNAQGQFYTNDPVFYNGNGLYGNVVQNTDRNLRISMAVSGANETPVPKWMGNVIQIGRDYFMMRYDIGSGLDLESTATLVPGDNATFTLNATNLTYPDRVLM